MSPYLRSMLEDAADDSGRPAMLDVEGIRAAGRRAVWRRRGIAAGAAAGATAVVTTVAIVVGTGGIGQTDVAPSAADLEAAGLSASAAPLIAAIEAAGYEVDLGSTGSSGAGESSGGGESGGSNSASSMTVPVTRDSTSGALRLTEFSSFGALVALASGDTTDGGTESICAMPPPVSEELGFTWGTCSGESSGSATISSVEGVGTGVEAIGSTVVLAEDTGFSVTLSTAPLDDGWFAYDSTPPPADAPLTALPLTVAELADVMAEIAADGGSLLSTEPSPDEDASAIGPCVGKVIVELSDELGRSEMVEAQGQRYVCSYALESHYPDATWLVSDFPSYDPPLEAWQFGTGLLAFCGGLGPCSEGMLTAVGTVPDGVARITFEPFNGSVTEATIVDGTYLARVAPALLETGALAPTTVRLYDAAGTLLLEGDATAPGGPTDDPATTPDQ